MFLRKITHEIPVCIDPWVNLGLSWGHFATCCNAYELDFGSIDSDDNSNVDIFNFESYLKLRKSLIDGKLLKPCVQCPRKCGGMGSAHQVINQYLNGLLLIEDKEQQMRAKDNLILAINSVMNGESSVKHDPSYLNISCGSACNIRCKFCYNCLMDYNPKAEDIMRIVDRYHRNLIMVQLTGGEPLITKSGRTLLEEFGKGKYKFGVRLGTNAQWTDFDILKPVNLVEVQISSDGATKKTYEDVRIGGDFENLIKNIKQFIKLKEERPYMVIRLNYTVTSDNYRDIPAAVELYEGLGLFVTFNLVIREKNDPQNIKERNDLHDDLLKHIDRAIAISKYEFTIDTLNNMKDTILKKIK